MTTTAVSPAVDRVQHTGSSRIVSIDIFRGLTMAVMIFVNELAGVHGLPRWTYHMPANVDAMTYVDMVYPFFLFIVGLSLPLSVRHRLKQNPSTPALWMHVIVRSFSLVVLGLILANAEKVNPVLTHIRGNLWAVLALIGGVLLWNVYPGLDRRSALVRGLRLAGLVLLVAMYAIFRRTAHDGHVAWIDFGYPEILGLIGLTYFAVSLLYIPTRKWLWAPLAWFVALVVFNCAAVAKWITFNDHLPMYVWPFDNGAMASLVMGGVVVSAIFLGAHRWQAHREKTILAVVFGVACLIAGWFLTPLGISKIRATPTWALYCVGAATLCFALLHWICDVKKRSGWAFFVRSAGSNTLMTYLLPDFYDFLLPLIGLLYFEVHFNFGWPGVVKSVIFTFFILAVSALLTRLKVRMQL
jgi:heparan-alpha-glucosaminide N-acetyltransferase